MIPGENKRIALEGLSLQRDLTELVACYVIQTSIHLHSIRV